MKDREAIDLLTGSTAYRERLAAGQPVAELLKVWAPEREAFLRRRAETLLYS